ncbi:tungstate/molybdate transport system ATP-binding protein [Methanospirillum hungatei JF-1]|uniref:Molybdate/tungstate import ATP-binding protein WtpC n=1 Tax=Methanospirillum hungatei JF-1 (strain ATCC 27890 / DSM 864 / NBRC 100397 / JF-1) TaxID=323259 RepID=Q2FNW2_METHJ|nr:tungstate ABC transporter ATP-binding protein WtpC [Methanospirillum hungatei]ABD41071.1 tungstate/molybdate transport system ATP-binding protein [Methanospirillum hungatei JF-1]
MLHTENLSKDMGEFVLRNVTLDVSPGEYLVIIGPTGAGKTILLETIAGFYPPDSGRIIMDGKDITNLAPKDRNICMVYQDYMLFPHLTVEENIGFGLKTRKKNPEFIKKKTLEMARLLSIDHLLHRKPETLSGGEQQRAAISRSLVMEPNLLLLDEPLSALDGQTRDKLRTELRRIHDITNVTVIHITHNFEEVFSLADRVAIMNKGEISQIGDPDEVFRKPESEFIAAFTGMENIFKGECSHQEGISAIKIDGYTIYSATCIGEREVYATVRPEDILLSRDPIVSSARNSFKGRITDIKNNGMVIKVTIDVGIPIVSVMTRRGWDEMHLTEDEEVYLTFKASAVHVF